MNNIGTFCDQYIGEWLLLKEIRVIYKKIKFAIQHKSAWYQISKQSWTSDVTEYKSAYYNQSFNKTDSSNTPAVLKPSLKAERFRGTQNEAVFHSPCSCQKCGTSARCRHWPLDPDLWARRTAWTHAAWADQMDTQSWTSYTTDAFLQPAGRPRCSPLNSPSLNWLFWRASLELICQEAQPVCCAGECFASHRDSTPGPKRGGHPREAFVLAWDQTRPTNFILLKLAATNPAHCMWGLRMTIGYSMWD